LDIRIYNLALLSYIGFDKMEDEDRAELAKMRGPLADELSLWKTASGREPAARTGMEGSGEAAVSALAQTAIEVGVGAPPDDQRPAVSWEAMKKRIHDERIG
jgi:hypothetical protein